MHSPHRPSHSPRLLPATLLVMAGLVVTAAGVAPATAADTPEASAQWGPQGVVRSTDSAVTVRWDDQYPDGATPPPAADRVARDATHVLTDSGGAKTYDDLDPTLRDYYQRYFGASNGRTGDDGTQGLQMTVSQTRDLINQSVNVRLSGAVVTNGQIASTRTTFAMVQCWGAGDETNPDPAHCEFGSRLTADGSNSKVSNVDGRDQALLAPGATVAPTGIDGSDQSAYNNTTTNELGGTVLGGDGSVDQPFQVLTGAESNFLGCGLRDDAPSTDSCWLVVVPLNQGMEAASGAFANANTVGAISPSLWAQRMQVKLSMAPVLNGCPNGQARTLGSGSELLPIAMSSWIPAVCQADDIALGYTPNADFQSRQQYQQGAQSLIFTTDPLDDSTTTAYAPVALSGVTFAFNVVNNSSQVRQLKLDPLLIAKLLTESYLDGIDTNADGTQLSAHAPWIMTTEPFALSEDPEFMRLNPGVAMNGNNNGGGDVVVSNLASDAASQIWPWLLASDAARAFLHGCPDANGYVINPFFSTRTYEECLPKKDELDADAQAKIDGTQSPDTFTYGPMSYPSDSTVFPQPGWYARQPVIDGLGKVKQGELSLVDLHPHVNALADSGATAARGVYPSNSVWCDATQNISCAIGDQPGMWKASGATEPPASRSIIALTDTATAAKFQLSTAQLCDDSGAHCVGADGTSLRKAASTFTPSGTPGVEQVSDESDYASGAYPLTMPVYAAVQTDGLSKDDAKTIATALGYITTDGQKPGVNQGQLPPGYAPLTSTLLTQAHTTIAALTAPPTEPGGDDQPGDDQPGGGRPSDGGGAQPGDNGGNPPGGGGQQPAGDGQNGDGQNGGSDDGGQNNDDGGTVPTTTTVPTDDGGGTKTTDGGGGKQTPPPTLPPDAVAAAVKTPRTASGFPQYGLAGGLIGALLAVGIAPVVGAARRRKG
ncbi:MAG TPA: hypothetical protein VGC45_00925 [Gryllotalpicola sp.]